MSNDDIMRNYSEISELIRCFLTINDNEFKYERRQAMTALEVPGSQGKWLLRSSSMNRPEESSEQERLKRMGIVYYALSANMIFLFTNWGRVGSQILLTPWSLCSSLVIVKMIIISQQLFNLP